MPGAQQSYAPALDGAKNPCRVHASNAGQVLFTGIASSRNRQDASRTDCCSPQVFSGWGIGTVAGGEARYNPMSYHNGSIWPHDNALIALGLARYGRKHSAGICSRACSTPRAIWSYAGSGIVLRVPARAARGPVLYPVACAPQAWASATPFTLLEASFGLEFDPAGCEIRLRDPHLPEFLNKVVLRNLRLGEASVDLRVRRHGEEVSLEVLRTRGQIQVSIVLTH